jgi:uncharacterized protein
MTVSAKWPGVYVEEFAPAPPIGGASTSITALLGPAKSGPILEPTFVSSWDQFKQIFGDKPVDGFYLWYAARGFFENEGTQLWVVRISNAKTASLPIDDRAGAPLPTVVVSALDPGAAGNGIQVTVTETQALGNTTVFKHDAAITGVSGTKLTFGSSDDAAKFRPGDLVSIASDAAPAPRASILSISNDTVTLTNTIASAANGEHLRLADLETAEGDTVLRLDVPLPDDPVNLVPGTILYLDNGASNEYAVVDSVTRESINTGPPIVTYRVTLRQPVANDYGRAGGDPVINVKSREFDLTVDDGVTTENYHHLSVDPTSPHYYGALVNGHSQLVSLAPPSTPDTHSPPENLPAGPYGPAGLLGGADEALAGLLPADYQDGLDTLVNFEVDIVAIPDRQDATVQNFLLDHCEGVPPKAGDRFAIFDSQLGAPITGAGSVADHIAALTGNSLGFGALYYPWVLVPPAPPTGIAPPPVAPPNVLVPPSGHIAGMYARTDNSRGVHKAPAGSQANLHGTIAVERVLGDVEQGLLNLAPYGINVIRVFRGGQPRVWGARTNAVAAGNTNWQYVNVRRLFLFLERSISEGIRFAVFEPNNIELWGQLKRSITAFLTRVWRDGALFGATAKDAYYVRIDDVLNPPDQMALGYLTVEIGVRPAYPAEFVIVRIGIWPGGATVTETP